MAQHVNLLHRVFTPERHKPNGQNAWIYSPPTASVHSHPSKGTKGTWVKWSWCQGWRLQIGHQQVLQFTKADPAITTDECPACPLCRPIMSPWHGTISQEGKVAICCQVVKWTALHPFHIPNPAAFSCLPQVFIPGAFLNKHLTCWPPSQCLIPREHYLWQCLLSVRIYARWLIFVISVILLNMLGCSQWWLPLRVRAGSLRGLLTFPGSCHF